MTYQVISAILRGGQLTGKKQIAGYAVVNMNSPLLHHHEQIERRAAARAANTVRCPNCFSPHVEQDEPIEFGQAPFVWHNPGMKYAVYAYTCQTCGAEFVTGSTECYHRQHHEASAPVVLH
jgi:hypothetical protein